MFGTFIKWEIKLLLLVFLLSSCSENKRNFFEKDQLEKISVHDQIKLSVDSVTVNKLNYPQVLDYEDRTVITSINVVDNTLKIFDLNSGEFFKSLNFFKEGPNGLTDLLAVHILSPDSILYLDKVSNLFILNKELKITKKLKFKNEKERGLPLFYDNFLPIVRLSKSQFFAANYYTNMPDRKLNVVIDIVTDSLYYLNPVPSEAVIGFYAIGDFNYWNYVYVESSDSYVFNFPNLDSLYVFNSKLNFERKIIANSKLKDSRTEKLVKERLEISQNYRLNQKKIEEKMKSSFVYSDLIYNESKERFYRIVGLPISQANLDLRDPVKSEVRDYSIVVLDRDLKIIDELLIPYNEYMIKSDCFFVFDGKLYFQRNNVNEDEMVFDAFDI